MTLCAILWWFPLFLFMAAASLVAAVTFWR